MFTQGRFPTIRTYKSKSKGMENMYQEILMITTKDNMLIIYKIYFKAKNKIPKYKLISNDKWFIFNKI